MGGGGGGRGMKKRPGLGCYQAVSILSQVLPGSFYILTQHPRVE